MRKHKRQIPTESKVVRSIGTRPLKMHFYVFCEGKNTEPDYLRDYKEEHKAITTLKVFKEQGKPEAIVREACEHKGRLSKEERALPNEFWVVFDRDNHDRIDEAFKLARQNDIHVAFSNPCFELWALLHFQEQAGHIEGKKVQSLLQQHMPSYDHERGARVSFAALFPKTLDAEKRARTLLARADTHGSPHGNPSTTLWLLLKRMRHVELSPEEGGWCCPSGFTS